MLCPAVSLTQAETNCPINLLSQLISLLEPFGWVDCSLCQAR